MQPNVDDSREAFSWGRPDLAGLRKFCVDKLDYTLAKADEVLRPVMKAFDSRQAQTRMDSFVIAERAAVIQSARIAKAVKSLRHGRSLTKDMAINEATVYTQQILSDDDDHDEEAGSGTARGSSDATTEGDMPPMKITKRKRTPKAKPANDSGGGTGSKPAGTKPKRVKTAFFLFVDDFRLSYKAEKPNAKQPEIASAAGARWREMSNEEKAPYLEAHAELKARQLEPPQSHVVDVAAAPPKEGPGGLSEKEEEPESDTEDDDFVPAPAPRGNNGNDLNKEAAKATAGGGSKRRRRAAVSYGGAMDGTNDHVPGGDDAT